MLVIVSPPIAKMGKTGDEEAGFAFDNLAGADNYKEWAREMRFDHESAGIWDHTLAEKENPKPGPIKLEGLDREDDAKLERQEKRQDKITAWNKSNSKCKGYIGRMCLGHIQQEFEAIKTEWVAHDLWEWLKKRYTLQNAAGKWATISSIDELSYASCKNMAEYRSKYYALKASVVEQKITIQDALKIRMLNNLGPSFKTYLTVVNDRMRAKEMLDDDETLFKAIEEEETRMKAEQKAFAKFASAKSQSKTQNKEKEKRRNPRTGLSVRNVGVSIWLTRHVSMPIKNVTSVTRKAILLDSTTATPLITRILAQAPPLPLQIRTLSLVLLPATLE